MIITTELEKSSSRQTSMPNPEIMNPRPPRVSTHHPSPLQVMQGVQPIPVKLLESILKHSAFFV